MPRFSTVAASFEESDIVHLVPPLQGGSEGDGTQTSTHAGKLAVGCYRCLGDLLVHDRVYFGCSNKVCWSKSI